MSKSMARVPTVLKMIPFFGVIRNIRATEIQYRLFPMQVKSVSGLTFCTKSNLFHILCRIAHKIGCKNTK